MLSRLLLRSKEVGTAQPVQQTLNIFLTLHLTRPTLPRQISGPSVLTQQPVVKYTKNVRLLIRNVSHGWFLVFQDDKYFIKRTHEARAMHCSGVSSHTKVQDPDFARLVRHSLRRRIART